MGQSDRPTSDISTPSNHRPGGLLLIEVVAMVLILAGIILYFLPGHVTYSDDPRVDRAMRELVAYCPRENMLPQTGPIANLFGTGSTSPIGSSLNLTPEESRRLGWLLTVGRLLPRRSGAAQNVPQGSDGALAQGTAVDNASLAHFAGICVMCPRTDARQTRVLAYSLGMPWGIYGGWAVTTQPLPLADKDRLEVCVALAAKAAGWEEADRVLRDTEGLTDDQRQYVQAEAVRRGVADPFANDAAYDRTGALLRSHLGLNSEQAGDVLAVLALKTIYDAPAEVRGALRRRFAGKSGFSGTMVGLLLDMAQLSAPTGQLVQSATVPSPLRPVAPP